MIFRNHRLDQTKHFLFSTRSSVDTLRMYKWKVVSFGGHFGRFVRTFRVLWLKTQVITSLGGYDVRFLLQTFRHTC